MKTWLSALLPVFSLLFPPSPLAAETIILRSGKAVEIIDGALPETAAEEVQREALDWLKKGRLDYARETWQLLAEKGKGAAAARAASAQERIPKIEYGSSVVLKDGKIITGKVKANLRTDLLGLEGKEEIPIWQIEEIIAEYHPGYSQVSKTYYPLILLEIKLRGQQLKTSRITQELTFVVEGGDGSVTKAILGKEYEVLRPQDLGGQMETLTADRILKVVIYPEIRKFE
jgi:hypothetical protein